MKKILVIFTLLTSGFLWADDHANHQMSNHGEMHKQHMQMGEEHADDMHHEGLAIYQPWIRAVAPGQKMSAAFLQIMNHEDKARELMAAKADFAKAVEVHKSEIVDGVMTMKLQKSVAVAANGMLELKPGGYHIMFIALSEALNEGDEKQFTLVFADGEEIEVTAKVVIDMDKPPMEHKHH